MWGDSDSLLTTVQSYKRDFKITGMNPKFLATAQTTVGTLVLDLETQAQSIKFCYALSRLL